MTKPERTYSPGERWTYDARDGELDSRVLILRVVELPGVGEIVCIAVNSLGVTDPNAPSGFHERITFAPFTKRALDGCLIELEGMSPVQDHESLYSGWVKAYEIGNAGVFEQSVGTAVRKMASMYEDR